jgi:hypothetical protein
MCSKPFVAVKCNFKVRLSYAFCYVHFQPSLPFDIHAQQHRKCASQMHSTASNGFETHLENAILNSP